MQFAQCHESTLGDAAACDVLCSAVAQNVSKLRGDARTGRGIAEALGADRDRSAPARIRSSASAPRLHAAHPDDRDRRPRCDTAWTCASAIARTAGPETPPVAPPQPRLARVRGSSAIPRIVLISDTRVGAGVLGRARRPPATSVAFGVSLTISGLAVSGLTRSSSARDLARVGAHHQPGLDVRAGDVELERRDLVALRERAHQLGHLVAAEAHHVDDQRHRQPRELGQVVLEVAVAGPCWAGRSS